MITETKVIRVTPLNGTIYKSMTSSGRPGFAMDTTLHLEDGTQQLGKVCYQRKKDVMPGFERQQQSAAAGCMQALFSDGQYWGVRQTFVIGGAGLVNA